MGMHELAKELGVSRQRAHQLTQRVVELAVGPKPERLRELVHCLFVLGKVERPHVGEDHSG